MGGSPRGPARRAGGTLLTGHPGGAFDAKKIALVVAATCALALVLWRAGVLEGSLVNGSLGGRGAAASPRSGGVPQPATAYGRLLREEGLLPGGSSDNEGAGARVECASSYPSITEHLLRGFHLPNLDVDEASDDADADADADAAAAEEDGDGDEGGSRKTKTKKVKRAGGFVYHRESAAGGVEGVRRDPAPRHGSCAVVGSSRVLLGAQRGGEIDAHDAIVRFDDAPTRGFENILGRRTTYRVASPAFVASIVADSPTAVKTIAGVPHLVPGAKALVVVGDCTSLMQL
jgi:hypothetical protein